METSNSPRRELAEQRSYIEDLLRRYPNVSDDETAEILRYLKKGPPLDVALMTADDELRPQLQRFRSDHASQFNLGLKEYLLAGLLVILVIGLCIALWDIGVGG